MFAPADRPLTLAVRVVGALLVLPSNTVVTGVTGLHLWGVTLGQPEPLAFATTSTAPVRRAGVHVTRVHRLPARRGRRASPEACFVAATSALGLVDGVAAGDWLVRRGRTTPAKLIAAAAVTRGRGCRLVRTTAALVRRKVDSPP